MNLIAVGLRDIYLGCCPWVGFALRLFEKSIPVAFLQLSS